MKRHARMLEHDVDHSSGALDLVPEWTQLSFFEQRLHVGVQGFFGLRPRLRITERERKKHLRHCATILPARLRYETGGRNLCLLDTDKGRGDQASYARMTVGIAQDWTVGVHVCLSRGVLAVGNHMRGMASYSVLGSGGR
jgi:hypothetical protein